MTEIEQLRLENQNLKKENDELKERLKKYTARAKRYYENNKEVLIKRAKEYHAEHKTPEDKRREYNRKAYLKRKEGNIDV